MQRPAFLTDNSPPAWLVTLAIMALPVTIACHSLANNDLPMHLAIGRWIVHNGSLPASDPFSFNSLGSWVPHEWLAALLFYGLHQLGGLVALVLGAMAFSAVLAWVHQRCLTQLGMASTTLLLWSPLLWLVAGRRLMLRPHLLALILPFVLWWLLLKARQNSHLLWAVPGVMVVWVNLHGSFLMGYGIVFLDLWVCHRHHAISRGRRVALSLLTVATLLTQIHVYQQDSLLAGLQHALGLLREPVFMETVQEWIPPLSDPAFMSTLAFQGGVVLLAVVLWRALRRSADLPLSYELFVAATLLLFLRHQRFLGLFALAALPYLPAPRTWLTHWRPVLPATAALLLVVTLGYPVTWRDAPRKAAFRWGSNHPFEAMSAMARASGPQGQDVFCEYEYGSMLAWLGNGRWRPSMDSRNSVYGAHRYVAHEQALAADTDTRREFLQRCQWVLIHHPNQDPRRQDLAEQLVLDPTWTLVPLQGATILFQKTQ